MTSEDTQPSAEDSQARTVYVHVGSGRTPSIHYCRTCDGFYGVPHDGDVHTRRHRLNALCACRPCQEATGRWPHGGVFMTLAEAERSDPRRVMPRDLR